MSKVKTGLFGHLFKTYSETDTIGRKNESTFGLPSCYCATCDPIETVGKVYNGLCYFITLDDEFLLSYTYMEQHQVIKSSYSPPLIKSPEERLLLIAIANELYASKQDLIIDPLSIVFFNGSHDENSQYKFPVLTISDGRYWIDSVDGLAPMIGVLMARPGFFTVKPPFVPPVYTPCTFESNAAQYQEDWCMEITNASECQLFNISSLNDMITVYNYTVSKYQARIPKLADSSTSFKIGSISQELSSKFNELAMYPNTKTNENSCLYLDLHGKQILYDECSRSTSKVCMIQENPNIDEEQHDELIDDALSATLSKIANGANEGSGRIWPRYDNSTPSTFGLPDCFCSDCTPGFSAGKKTSLWK